jgi:F0F1-type ATP synthase membrane subunit c/vacuolar-type H+-ATPase subunit K
MLYAREHKPKDHNQKMAAVKFIGAGLSAIGLYGAGYGLCLGTIFGSLIASTARKLANRVALFTQSVNVFALASATGLFPLIVSFIILSY